MNQLTPVSNYNKNIA